MITGINILYFTLFFYFYYGALTWKFFQAAGRKPWEAFVPIYNLYITIKIIDRPWWWIVLMVLPVVGNVMFVVTIYELFHVFKMSKVKHTVLTIVTLGLYLGYVNYTQKLEYKGRDFSEIRKNVSELVASIFFAIVAAAVIRAYTFEAFVIPTPSMEKSLMVGDFLFVSKMHYGSRMPITPISFPLVHNQFPLINAQSYSDFIQMPILRLPGFSKIERNDPFVFNYPMQTERPIDMRDHYVKRCLALPGDTLQIKKADVFINGKPNKLPTRAKKQHHYLVKTTQAGLNPKTLKENFDVNAEDIAYTNENGIFEITLADTFANALLALPNVKEVARIDQFNQKFTQSNPVFPNSYHTKLNDWSLNNYGPIVMPKEGDVIQLSKENFTMYSRIIEVYEGNTLRMDDKGDIYINEERTNEYTIQQNYYWAMGDNRHNSLDSRYWGFVPEDHIVGKPVFIWMSFDQKQKLLKGFRTERIFTTVNGGAKRFSYFWPFVIVVIGITFYNRQRKKKKEAKA